MEKLIGIVIPDSVKTKIIDFCIKYDPGLTEPHMTLVYPEKLEAVKGLDRKMQSFCLSQPPFKTIIGGPNIELSDKGTTLYLSVMMGPLNTVRDNLIKHLKIQAGSFYRGRLVLISDSNDSSYDFNAIFEDAKKTFSQAQEFSAEALAIYSRKSGDRLFRIESTYPFTGRRR